ncbi:MAG: aminopeptidase P family protein [Actinobacteria bacterium]|nr:aminopeptidase P family protein [Actinomycetota bacterium]
MSANDKVARLRERMAELSLDGMMICHNSDLHWLTGFPGFFDEEEAHCACITKDVLVFHTDSRYTDLALRAATGSDWRIDSEPCTHSKFIARQLTGSEHARIGIEHDLPLNEYRALGAALGEAGVSADILECRNEVLKLRAIKESIEIDSCRAAQEIADAAFAHLCGWMKVGMAERDVALELEFFMRRLGSEGLSFPSIVAAGANAASPHSIPGKTRIVQGDLVILDFGACVGGYRSDMTRTVCFGHPSPLQREIYDIVKTANEVTVNAIRAGVSGKEIHAVAAGIIRDAGYGEYFSHGLGHGVGLDVHELPVASPRSEDILEASSIITVEPGIYLPGVLGVRIEDFGVVTKTGFDVLGTSTRELMVL